MDLVLAILLFLNIIAPGQVPTQDVINANQHLIEEYSQDQQFLNMYHTDGIAIFDLEGGD
ncbi:MAG: hypothetical protein AAGN35_25920 [Bacteroidota bacterium]